MRSTVDILGIPVDKVTMQEALQRVRAFLSGDRVHSIYTPNAEIVMAAQRDAYLRDILREADMLVADGAGVVLGSKILGGRLPEKVAGFDLVNNIFSFSDDQKIRFFLFGGRPGIAEAAAANIVKSYPGIEIAGCRHGYFPIEDEKIIIDKINSSHTDILLVALGAPKQEKWIHDHKKDLRVKICIGVGGSLDVLAGTARLAPAFFRKNSLEWLYRLYKEPRRFGRMLDLPLFVLHIFIAKFRKRL